MVHRRLQENPVRIDWDGLGQFRSLNVPLLFPQSWRFPQGPMVPMFHLVWNSSFSNTQKITLSARRHRSPLNVLRMAHILNPWRFRFRTFTHGISLISWKSRRTRNDAIRCSVSELAASVSPGLPIAGGTPISKPYWDCEPSKP